MAVEQRWELDHGTTIAAPPQPVSERRLFGVRAESLAVWGMAALTLYAFLRSLFFALSKAFWYDEMCTLIVARQPDWSAVMRALRSGADSNPPGFYLIERLATQLISNEQIALRIAFALGLACTAWCLFVFVRRRSGAPVALLSASISLTTLLVMYGAEARPYALVIASVSFALVCYQRAPSPTWMALMGLSLAAAETFHYYAIFAVTPFAIAEAVVVLKDRRIRWRVWVPLACASLPLAAWWPLLSKLKEIYGDRFWSQPSLQGVAGIYGEFLHLPAVFGLAVFAAAAIGVLWAAKKSNPEERQGALTERAGLEEYALIVALLALPVIVFAITRAVHGGLVTRYVLPAALGIPLAAGCVLRGLPRSAAFLFVNFIVLCVGLQEAAFWRSHAGGLRSPAQPAESLIAKTKHDDLPVVLSPFTYLSIQHYASADWRNRFVTLLDSKRAIENVGTDNMEVELRIFAAYAPLRATEYEDFIKEHPIKEHPAFLVYASNSGDDWWPTALAREHDSVELLAGDGDDRVFLVHVKSESRQ